MEEHKKLVLIDGNSLFFKAFFAAFYSKKGNHFENKDDYFDESNNGLRAFINMMILLSKDIDHILVAFDHKNMKTKRHQHDFYKKGRSKAPKDLFRQLNLAKEFLNVYGISWYEDENLEADDIIGIVAKNKCDIFQTEIITSDKDLLQLVQKNVCVKLSKTGVSNMDEFNIENFTEKFSGINPTQVIDLKGIMGDASDNLPGIKGIGEKGAIKLLKKYETLENLLDNHHGQETESLSKKIIEGKEMGILSKEIATINVEYLLEDHIYEKLEKKKLNTLELRRWLNNNKLYNIARRFE